MVMVVEWTVSAHTPLMGSRGEIIIISPNSGHNIVPPSKKRWAAMMTMLLPRVRVVLPVAPGRRRAHRRRRAAAAFEVNRVVLSREANFGRTQGDSHVVSLFTPMVAPLLI
jgi:hypothetical protein